MKTTDLTVAVVGATGAVGEEMVKILEERKFPLKTLRLFASGRSAGKTLTFRGKPVSIEELRFERKTFEGVDLVLSSAGSTVSKKFLPFAKEAGAVVVDNTSAFRMDPDVPLVVPEINPTEIAKHRGVIANPNCSTIIMLLPIYPIYRAAGVRRAVVSTYQSASGAGRRAMTELENQTRDFLAGVPLKKEIFPHQIAFNLFSHNSAVGEDGATEEETKMVREAQKILKDPALRVATMTVRVPVLRAHSEAIFLETERKLSAREAREILSKSPGVRVVDDRARNHFPMPIEASGLDQVLVGRIREDASVENGLAMFVSGDQLRKGAALNAVQIAEQLVRPQVPA